MCPKDANRKANNVDSCPGAVARTEACPLGMQAASS